MIRWSSLALLFLMAHSAPFATADTGFQAEVKVEKPTRLDWEFVTGTFGADALKLPTDYLSYRQRFQLFVPPNYDAKKAWPLLVFLSPGDDPLGWRSWQEVCEKHGVFFCAAYGAGNNQRIGTRLRIVLDMFDDVRRHYSIDPDQTYFAGLGDGGRMASAMAVALPELCGGVVLIGATPASPRLDYLRHRAQERVSVAFVSGEKDAKRREVEDYWHPYYRDLGIGTRWWSVKSDHDLPPTEVLAEVYSWLAQDLPRRRKDAETWPKLAWKPNVALDGPSQAARLVETAQAEIVLPGHLYRGITLLQGIEARWPKSDAAEKAHLMIREVQIDQRLKQLLAEQTAAEERHLLVAQARAKERMGELATALAVYEKLATNHSGSDDGKKAVEDMKRLKEKLAATPYLGIAFEEDSVTIRAVAPNGPAERAGLHSGDRIIGFGTAKIDTLADLRTALTALKPGAKTTVEIRRDGKRMSVPLEIAGTPLERGH